MKRFLSVIIMVLLMIPKPIGAESLQDASVKIDFKKTLSVEGSIRGTAYHHINKIVSTDDKIFVTWLDEPPDAEEFVMDDGYRLKRSGIMIQAYAIRSRQWEKPVEVDTSADNHGGASLAIDSQGFLHIVYGPHNGTIQYQISKRPYDVKEWVKQPSFGIAASYANIVCGHGDIIYCVYRSLNLEAEKLDTEGLTSQEEMQKIIPNVEHRNVLVLQKKDKSGNWSRPQVIVDANCGKLGYGRYDASMAVGRNGTLHLGFDLYNTHLRLAPGEEGRSPGLGYIRSSDQGESWQNASGQTLSIPITFRSNCFIEFSPSINVRAATLAIDSQQRPWFLGLHHSDTSLTSFRTEANLWYWEDGAWQLIQLSTILDKKRPGMQFGYIGSLAIDNRDRIYYASPIETPPGGWSHPSQESVLFFSANRGKDFQLLDLSLPVDPNRPAWYPNLERPSGPEPLEGIPSLIYMRGGDFNVSNSPNDQNKDECEHMGTKIEFVKLAVDEVDTE